MRHGEHMHGVDWLGAIVGGAGLLAVVLIAYFMGKGRK